MCSVMPQLLWKGVWRIVTVNLFPSRIKHSTESDVTDDKFVTATYHSSSARPRIEQWMCL